MTPAGSAPQRSCIACREKKPAHDLLRFVCSPAGEVLLDYRHKLPGRGAYTCCSRSCYARALDAQLFSRAFRRPCKPGSIHVIVEQLRTQVQAKVMSLLGMARKAAVAVSGQQAILAALRRPHEIAWILVADDASASTVEKLSHRAQQLGLDVLRGIDKHTLALALGRGERSAVVLKKSSLALALKSELQRYVNEMGEV